MKTRKISTLRSNGFSIFKCGGNICRIASPVPFTYGSKSINQPASQGDYRIELRGHFTKELPLEVTK